MVFAGVSEVQVEEESVGQGLELPLGSCLGGSRRGVPTLTVGVLLVPSRHVGAM